MKILSLHCDYIKFKPLKKALKEPEELSEERKKEQVVKEPLVILTAAEMNYLIAEASLNSWVTGTTADAAYEAAITCLDRYLIATLPVRRIVTVCHIASESGNVFNVGKRYRLTSSHAPIFSLFTYFGNRQ